MASPVKSDSSSILNSMTERSCLTDDDLKNFVWDLGKEGFVLQLISLAGLHLNAAATGDVVYVITWNLH